MTARPLLPNQPVTANGLMPSRDLVEIIQRLVKVAGTGGGGLSDGNYGDVTVSGGGTVITVNSGAVSWAEVSSKPVTFAPSAHTHVAADVTDLATTVQAYTLDTFANPVASLDFAQQQTLQFVIENRTSDPGSPATGQMWLRTDL
jgi:hypothetical protein